MLTARALNRATLGRQLLLRRHPMPPLDAVRHLVGLQAQVPANPYVALWSRLDRFHPEELSQLLLDRRVVRIVVMRGTIHLVTAADCLVLRPLVQPVLDRELSRHAEYAPLLRGVDLEPVLAFAGPLLAQRPLSNGELRAAMRERFPEHDPGSLAYARRNHLALVQVPPRGLWGRSGQVRVTTSEAWLGEPVSTRPSVDEVMLRYLGAFGPATVADASTWSRLTGLREVFERLRPRLRTFRDERGRELFDVPDAPLPDPDTPPPPRFLPEYDNVLLSHDDRSRFVSEETGPVPLDVTRLGRGAVLFDGPGCRPVVARGGQGRGPGHADDQHHDAADQESDRVDYGRGQASPAVPGAVCRGPLRPSCRARPLRVPEGQRPVGQDVGRMGWVRGERGST